MKKLAIFVICVFLLSGCRSENKTMNQAISFRQKLLSSNQCTFTCDITVDYGDELHLFSVGCKFDDQVNLSFEVLKPDTISGISGTVRASGGELTFDDNALAFPLIADGYISPISAPWVFMKALRGGYIDSCGNDGGGLCLLLNDSYEENPLQIQVFADSQCVPKRAEMIWKGRRILTIDVVNFSCL